MHAEPPTDHEAGDRAIDDARIAVRARRVHANIDEVPLDRAVADRRRRAQQKSRVSLDSPSRAEESSAKLFRSLPLARSARYAFKFAMRSSSTVTAAF